MFLFLDVSGTSLAVCIFALLFLVPGYVVGFAGDLFGFRAADLNWRLMMSVPLSVAVTPLAVYLLLLTHSAVLPWTVFGIVQLAAVGLALGWLGHEAPRGWMAGLRTIPGIAVGIAIAWLAVALLSLLDLQIGQRLYYSAIAYDHEFRVAIIDAITRTGVSPVSPFNHINGDTPLRYHIFWFAVCSFAQRVGLGLIDSRDALNASVVWCGFALICLIPLSLRILEGLQGAILRCHALIGIGLLCVTGLDLIPTLGLYLHDHGSLPSDMEWWSLDQVTAWTDAVLFAPHHVAALVAGFTGFLLLWQAAVHIESRQGRITHAMVAGVAFASAAGCSIYVGAMLAATIGAWMALTFVRRTPNHAIPNFVSAFVGILLALPYLLHLVHTGGSGRFLRFGLWNTASLLSLLHIRTDRSSHAIHLFFVPLAYLVEFGFFLLAGVVKLSRLARLQRLRPQDEAGLVMAGTTLIVCTFVRSASIGNNDFGWRGFMILQFWLLLWATEIFDFPRAKWLPLAYALIAVGCAGTIYQLAMLRVYDVLADSGTSDPQHSPGADGRLTYSLRALYRQLDRTLPPNAVVQSNPDAGVGGDLDPDYRWGLYAHRQTVSTGKDCSVAYGGSAESCKAAFPELQSPFNDTPKMDERAVGSIARKYGIDAMIVKSSDSVWRDKQSWIYQKRPAAEMPEARAYVFP
jgi:hypothetical protein